MDQQSKVPEAPMIGIRLFHNSVQSDSIQKWSLDPQSKMQGSNSVSLL